MLIPPDLESELQFRLLQRIGSTHLAEERIQDIVTRGLDWDSVVNMSLRHGTVPQLHTLICDLDIHPPESVKKSLRERYEHRALENINHVDQLATIVQEFSKRGIRAIPYKGPMVTQVAYDELGQRWFSDLDILVAPEDILDAREVLQEIGYRQLNLVGVSPTTLVNGSVFRWGGEFHFESDDGIPVELRYRFVGKNKESQGIFHHLWDNRTYRQIAGQEFPALSIEDRLVVLLAHGTKHGWNRLSWIYDIALLLQQDVDWENLLKQSKKYGWQSAILLGLAVTAELAEVELPSEMRQAIMDNTRAQIGSSVIQQLYQDLERYAEMNINTIMAVLYLNNSLDASARELIDIIFSPWEKDYQWISLPPSLYPLYYIIRPCRLGASKIKWLINR